jgi:pimeloyl-ACP methyl ester carboxylesterase
MPAPGPALCTLRLPDGRQLGVARFGNPTDPAIIFHHGFGSSGLDVPPDEGLLRQLGVQVLAPDRPGVGSSDVDPHLSYQSFAADVMFAVDALGVPGPLAVLGWSVGGVHALALAAYYPARVATVHLLSTCLPLGERGANQQLSATWKALWWTSTRLPGLSRAFFAWLSRQWAHHPDRTIDWFIRLMRQAEQDVTGQPAFRALLRDAAARGFAHQGRGVYHDCRIWCCPPGFRLADVQAPTTLWHGLADGVWAPDNIPYLASRIPHGVPRLLPGQGHMFYLTHWAEILTAARQQLVG